MQSRHIYSTAGTGCIVGDQELRKVLRVLIVLLTQSEYHGLRTHRSLFSLSNIENSELRCKAILSLENDFLIDISSL